MKDGVKIILGIIVLGVIIGLCVFYTDTATVDNNGNIATTEKQDVVEDKVAKEPEVSNTANEIKEDDSNDVSKVENVTTTVLAQHTGSNIYETNSDVGSTSEKEKAINMVKQKWGEDDTVSFICDHVTEDGEYMIAVISNSFFEVQNYFRVNLENNTVYLEY